MTILQSVLRKNAVFSSVVLSTLIGVTTRLELKGFL